MKRLMVCLVSGLIGAAFGTEWPDSGEVTIPAGETWTATEADMRNVNKLTSITIEGGTDDTPAGVLEFDGCATQPKADLLKGRGVVKKTGSQVWTMDATQSGFEGDFRICGGQVIDTVAKSMGNTSKGTGAVYVESGASLKIKTTSVKYCYRAIHIAGTGLPSGLEEDKALSIIKAASGAIALLYLDDDASIYVKNDSNYYWVGNQGDPFGDGSGSSQIHTMDHALTKYGAMTWYILGLGIFENGGVRNQEGSVILWENSNLGGAEAAPFEFLDSKTFQFCNNSAIVSRPGRVADGVTLTVSYDTNKTDDRYHSLLTTNFNNWAGPFELVGETTKLWFQNGYGIEKLAEKMDDNQLSFMGNISGKGAVTVGAAERTSKGPVAFGGRNSYEGPTYLYGGMSVRLQAYWFDSIPDYTKTTVDRGYIAARPGLASDGVTERWPVQKLFDLHNQATYLKDGALAVNAEDCANETYELTAKTFIDKDANPDVGWGVDGGTFRIVAEEGDEMTVVPCAFRGTLELSGPGTFVTTGTNAINSVAGTFCNGATVRVSDGATVRQGILPVYVGRMDAYASDASYTPAYWPSSYASLVVSNANWLTTAGERPGTEDAVGFKAGAIYVGSHSRGILDVQSGGFVSNKVVVGGGKYADKDTRGDGAVYVGENGHLHITDGGAGSHYGSQLGHGGYGYLQLDPESKVVADPVFTLASYGIGVFHQYGGEYIQTGSSQKIAALGNGRAVVYVAGGTFSVNGSASEVYFFVGGGSNGRSYITVDGTESVINSRRLFYYGNSSSSETILNINHGGTFMVDRLYPYDNARPLIVNFDGGIFKKHGDSWATFLRFPNDNTVRAEFAVYGDGMAFDTDNGSLSQDCRAPFVGHVAGGVRSVDATKALAKDWIGAPYVTIEGAGGVGASAVADWDWKTRKLKGILITSPGWGYTQGSVTVTVKSSTQTVTLSGDEVTVGDNAIGGFTKLGANTFTLKATNTWQKWTAVNGGTLKVGSNGAIPPNTELRLNGGTLDLGGFDADAERPLSFTGLAGTGGTVANGAAVLSGVWEISAQKFIDRETTELAGTLDLSDVTEIRLTDTEALDDAEVKELKRMNLFSATTVIWPASLEITGAPKDWKLIRKPNGLSLGADRALMLIFR